MQLKWMNAENTILQVQIGANHYRIVEPTSDDWAKYSTMQGIEAYTPPSADMLLEEERASMICTPAQMRLALHRMGLLAQVQAIADSDPEASIVWEYATSIVRTSPLIEALGADFTPEEIDDIFRAAMAVQT